MLAATILIVAVFSLYIFHFYIRLGYVVSTSPEAWGQLGDYAGGLLNPLLSFISIVLLIKSLTLQNEANKGLRDEIESTRRTERLRSFETQLFNMINSQQSYFDRFKVSLVSDDGVSIYYGVEAVINIGDTVEALREKGLAVSDYLEEIDSSDQIYSLTRIFQNMVKVIDERLCDSGGFTMVDRRSYYLTLINFTDFSLLNLIMIAAQFMDYPSTAYLKSNTEFNAVLRDVGLGYDLY